MKSSSKVVLFMFILISIAACSEKESVIDDVHDHLNRAVMIEDDFGGYQDELSNLENKDSSLYEEIVEVPNGESETREQLIKEANNVLSEKKEILNEIRQMFLESKDEFIKIDPLISELNEEKYIDQVKKMYGAMMERYEAYESLHFSYMTSIDLTIELYDEFLEDDQDSSTVFSMIKNVNDSYDDIKENNELFNDNTMTYNALKSDFYELISED